MSIWDTRYLGKRQSASGTTTFSLGRPAGMDYAPGQFFFISIPRDGPGGTLLVHHFSFSSSPTEPDVEFTTRMTGHDFKNRMDALAPGTEVRIDAPHGTFVLGEGMKKVVYVCGGIGITPARSAIRWVLDTRSDVDVVALYANREESGIAFREELENISSRNVRIVNTLSDPGPDWHGPTGHLDARSVLENVPDWPERHFFVSGPPSMVAALADVLTSGVGVAADRLMVESFAGYE